MKKKSVVAGLLVIIFCMSQCLFAFAADTDSDDFLFDSAGNLFRAGEEVTVSNESLFTSFVMARNFRIDRSRAGGSVFALARDVEITDSKIDESLFVMAETVTIKDTPVHGNIFGMGKVIDISGESNSVYAFGDTINFDGTTRGLCLQGGTISLAGNVYGDVYISSARNVYIDPDIEITGKLTVTSETEPRVPDSAEIGSYEYETQETGIVSYEFESETQETGTASDESGNETQEAGTDSGGSENETREPGFSQEWTAPSGAKAIGRKIGKTIYWILAMSLFGLLLCIFFGEHLDRAGGSFLSAPGNTIARGLLGFIFAPPVILIMFITILLAPAAAMLLAAYVVLLCAATAFTGASLGRLILPKLHPMLSAVIGITALEVLQQIPFLGVIVGIICDMYMIAYVVYCFSQRQHRKTPEVTDQGSTEYQAPEMQAETKFQAPETREDTELQAPETHAETDSAVIDVTEEKP